MKPFFVGFSVAFLLASSSTFVDGWGGKLLALLSGVSLGGGAVIQQSREYERALLEKGQALKVASKANDEATKMLQEQQEAYEKLLAESNQQDLTIKHTERKIDGA